MIFLVVFILFSALIMRLGFLQIVYGDEYQRELKRTDAVTVSNTVPRGKMYDRNGNVIVDNSPLNAITYTRSQNTTQQQMLDTAEKLAKLISIDTSKIRDRDKRDFWLIKYPKKASKLITKAEQKKWDSKKVYQMQLQRIPASELNFSNEELKTIAILKQFNSGYALTPQIVKNNNVTPEEFAAVSQDLENLPGVDTTTDWDRKYVFGDTLKSVLGNVSSAQTGLPKDLAEQYLAQDYSRNDRVGTSYIEQEYENVLHGQKAEVKNITDPSGKVISTQVVNEGQRGDDLELSIDMDLQQQLEKIVEGRMWQQKQDPNSALLDRAYVVVMDPHTGEILSLVGKKIVTDANGKEVMQDDALGTFTTSYSVGSAVKGATVLTGYQTGAIHPGSEQLDEQLNIKGTPLKKSWKTFGLINDLTALQVSSNVYMWKTVIAMAGGQYVPGRPLDLNMKTFDTLRNYFGEFGLGVRTGIDLPNETPGVQGAGRKPGNMLDLGIGQYDLYTPLQLAQYVSTIANGGYRMQPHIVKEIREPDSTSNQPGSVIQEIEPNVLDRIDMKDSWIQRVQQGFHMVMQPGGTAYSYFQGASYDPAGKTGTAQAFYYGSDRSKWGTDVINTSLVGFAPFNNPEVAVAVLVPWAYSGTGTPLADLLGSDVFKAYFDLKKARETNGTTSTANSAANSANQTSGQ
ncbi:peptidoglycan D,D-transpeptidase FtsI family protein [Neobacillus endophyticus]|uniref:peptidoglycan D,D-transpeptidase FtsI family protein n=1 Tax=Neobacillus endophyticus TaxID=2738405 RepID=UPI001FE7B9DA|nr:penicillin-binding protein 2 [Neobacillus endophyticus]